MEKYSGSNNRKLVIQNACKTDEGKYYATISKDIHGKEINKYICLHIVGGMFCQISNMQT